MFVWNVEDMTLMNEKNGTYIGREKIYAYESELSREEKIAFVDEMQDGKLSYILQLNEKLMSEKDGMPHDRWGNIKVLSLKRWIKQNDTRNMIFQQGKIRVLVDRNIHQLNVKGKLDTYSDYVDEVFHRQLKSCARLEREYFFAIVALREKSQRFGTTFGVHLSFGRDNSVSVCGENTKQRKITLEEATDLLHKCTQIEELEKQLTKETHIVF